MAGATRWMLQPSTVPAMSKEQRVILVCDGCGADSTADGNGQVSEHRITVDGASWTVDACAACWGTVFKTALMPLTQHAGRVRIPSRPRRLRAVG